MPADLVAGESQPAALVLAVRSCVLMWQREPRRKQCGSSQKGPVRGPPSHHLVTSGEAHLPLPHRLGVASGALTAGLAAQGCKRERQKRL